MSGARTRVGRAPVVLLVALGFVALGCGAAQTAGPASSAAGIPLAQRDFQLDTVRGEPVQLSAILDRGDFVLMSFWSTWCEPCKLELPVLDRIQRGHEGKGVTVLAVAVDGPSTVAEVRSYVRRHDLGLKVPLDIERRVVEMYNPKVILPYWVLMDPKGRIVKTHQGYLPGDEQVIEAELRRQMAAYAQGAGGD